MPVISTLHRPGSRAVGAAACLAIGTLAATGAPARAEKQPAPACGITYMPFVPGAQWTYEYVPPDDAAPERGLRLSPPDKIIVRVVSVSAAAGGETEIKLSEEWRKTAVEVVLRCTRERLVISPHSILFAGEIGGGMNVELENVKREGGNFPGGRGLADGQTWEETLTGTVVRRPAERTDPQIPRANLELARQVSVTGRESVATAAGTFQALRVQVDLSGRAHVEGAADKAVEIPAGATGILWFAPGKGLVKVRNARGDSWLLTEYRPAGATPAAPAGGAASAPAR
jgi:hypothetical protein